MAEYYQLIRPDTSWTPKAGTRIIRRAEYAELCQANDLLRQVRAAAHEAGERAKAVYKERYDAGYRDGEEAGKGEYTEKIMDTVLSSIESIEALEAQMVQVVIACVQKIIGQFEPGDLVLRTVRQALNNVRGSKSITLRVCVAQEPLVRQQLSSFLLSADNSRGYIVLKADPNLKNGDCILETDMGVVDSSIDSQINILKKSMMDHIKQS